jgi:hypothetical protein
MYTVVFPLCFSKIDDVHLAAEAALVLPDVHSFCQGCGAMEPPAFSDVSIAAGSQCERAAAVGPR